MPLVEECSLTGYTTEIEAGRVTMRAEGGDAVLQVRAPEHAPLGEYEPAAVLVLAGEDLETAVTLNATEVDALADALYQLQADLQEAADGE